MKKKQYLTITTLGVFIFILAFLLCSKLYLRFDLTANKAYTLSEASRALYKSINGVLRISYYVSDRLTSGHPLPDEIFNLLNEYAAHSHGTIEVIKKDPVKTNTTEQIESLGIMPQTVRLIENSEVITLEVYTGIVIEYLSSYEVIPLAFSVETLEYDITSKILSVLKDREKTIGILVGNAEKQWARDFALLDAALKRAGYRVLEFVPGQEIPAETGVLFVLGGADEFDEWALYHIERFIRMGGDALFAQDALSVDLTNGLAVASVPDRGLFALLASYGALVLPSMVMDASSLAISYSDQNQNTQTVAYPQWISVMPQQLNNTHPVTGNLKGLYLYWASPIETAPPDGITAEVLIATTSDAWLQAGTFNADPLASSDDEQGAVLTRGTKNLCVVLSGIFPSFFTTKPVREGSPAELPDMPAVAQPSRVIVAGDEDFAGALMEIGGGEAMNTEFLVRAADWLFHDEETIGLRRNVVGGLDRITDLQRRKEVMDFSRILNCFVIPALIALTGIIVVIARRRKTLAPSRSSEHKGPAKP